MQKCELDTPALFLDLEIFERNLILMRDTAKAAGKKLRPHAKTHKCPEIAKRQLECGNCTGICAAKLSEAEKLSEAGIQNILITSPISAPWKIARTGKLNREISGLQLTVDTPEQIRLLAAQASCEHPLHLLIDVDPEMGRTGVSSNEALELAKFIQKFPNLIIDGVQCYAGHLQHIRDFNERITESTRLMKLGAASFNEIKKIAPQCHIFTGTGTGTMQADIKIPEVTDIQVGSYCMMDAEYLAVDHGKINFPPALRILASVINCRIPGQATIDAGTKAIYVTPGAPPKVMKNGAVDPDFTYDWSFGDEHGRLTFPENITLFPAQRLELIVSHCDPTVNLFDELWIVKGDEVIDRWEISLRGCCR